MSPETTPGASMVGSKLYHTKTFQGEKCVLPRRVKGSISKCVVSAVMSFGCSAMNRLFSSLTSTLIKS